MPELRNLQYSFSSGVISPEMFGRIDARAYANGVAVGTNFIFKPQGPAFYRPGFNFVNQTFDQAIGDVRILPFIYSDEQSLVVEFGEKGDSVGGDGYVRLHTQGGTLLWASMIDIGESSTVGAIDVTDDEITFLDSHGLTQSETVRFITDGTIPAGLSESASYEALLRDTRRIALNTFPGGVPVDITTVGSGYLRCVRADDLPFDYVPPTLLDGVSAGEVWNTSTNRLEWDDQPFFGQGNPAIRFVETTGGSLPNEVEEDVTYYVWGNVADGFFLVTDLTNPVVLVLTGSPTGSFTVKRYYEEGELAYWVGAPATAVYYCFEAHPAEVSIDVAKFYQQTADGILTIPSPYSEEDVFNINYVQSADVQTLVLGDQRPNELSRLSATRWTLGERVFATPLPAPSNVAVVENRGVAVQVITASTGTVAIAGSAPAAYLVALDLGADINGGTQQVQSHPFTDGEDVYVEWVSGSMGYFTDATTDGFYIVDLAATFSTRRAIYLRDQDGIAITNASIISNSGRLNVYYGSVVGSEEQKYKVSALDKDDRESVPSGEVTADNRLTVDGAKNALSWDAVTDAERYRIYKRDQTGLFGFIGETDELTFDDDNIGPDLGATPPILDEIVNDSTFTPTAVGYLEQRRVFGGTADQPQTIWLSRTGAPSDFSFSLPINDDDRISYDILADQAQTIRHIVSIQDLIVLTASGEWRVTTINSDAITPESIRARQQSSVGAATIQPVVVNNVVVFPEARGGHLREMGYQQARNGYVTNDLSIRAAHLFDSFTIVDLAFQKAPFPVIWVVSSNGKLYGFTYAPEEQVGAWHVVETAGDVKSVSVVPEGDVDAVYIVVVRDGQKLIERMDDVMDESTEIAKTNYLDASASFVGARAQTYTINMTVTGGKTLKTGDEVFVTASDVAFAHADVGDDVVLRWSGVDYRARVQEVISGSAFGQVRATLQQDTPSSIRNQVLITWWWARRRFTRLTQFSSQSVSVVADGVLLDETYVVPADGIIELQEPALDVHIGLRYTGTIKTLPQAMQIDGGGQGRTKNINRVWVRCYQTAGLKAGPNDQDLTAVTDSTTELFTGEIEVTLDAEWQRDGQIVIVQDQPFPATVVGLTSEVVIGD